MRTIIDTVADRPTTIRLRPAIENEIKRLADEMGISFNAAMSVLLSEALTARGRHPGSTRREHVAGS